MVVAVDDPGVYLSPDDSVPFTLSIGNVNEAPSIADQGLSVDENAANGTVVGTVVVSDPDRLAAQVVSLGFQASGTLPETGSVPSGRRKRRMCGSGLESENGTWTGKQG